MDVPFKNATSTRGAELRAGRSSVLVIESTDAMAELNNAPAPSGSATARPDTRGQAFRRHAGLNRRPQHQPPKRSPHPRPARRLVQERRPPAHHRRDGRGLSRRPATRHNDWRVRCPSRRVRRRARRPRIRDHRPPRPRHDGDTSHVVVTGSTTRENFYVAMTRGRQSNIAYVALIAPTTATPNPHRRRSPPKPACSACFGTQASS